MSGTNRLMRMCDNITAEMEDLLDILSQCRLLLDFAKGYQRLKDNASWAENAEKVLADIDKFTK